MKLYCYTAICPQRRRCSISE